MGKLWRGLNYVVFMMILIITMLALIFGLRAMVGHDVQVDRFLPFAVLIVVFLVSWERIITIARKKHLCFRKIPLLKPHHWLTLFVIFNVSLILTFSGAIGTVRALTEDGGGTVMVFAKLLVFLMGAMYLILLLTDIPFIGVKNYVLMFVRFLKSCIGAFFLYQVLFSLLSFLCSAIVLKTGEYQEGAQLTAAGFMFVVSGEFGVDNFSFGVGSVLSSLAAASTYFALTEIAYEFLKKGAMPSFAQQLKTMFFDTDTKFLLIMTVLSVVFMFITKVGSFPLYAVIFLVFLAAFVFSFFAFTRQRLVMFLINFTVMTLIETAIPFPSLDGFGSVFSVLVCFALRTLLFAIVALLCGYLYYVNDLNRGETGGETVVERAFEVSIFEAGAMAVWALSNPKRTAVVTGKTLLNKMLQKK